jgi:hypothetical protein
MRNSTLIWFSYLTHFRGAPAMKSKLLQKKSYCLDKSDALLDGQQENIEDSSEPFEAARLRTISSTWLLTPRPLRKHSSGSGA